MELLPKRSIFRHLSFKQQSGWSGRRTGNRKKRSSSLAQLGQATYLAVASFLSVSCATSTPSICRLQWLSALYVHIFRGQSVVVHTSAYFLLFTVSLRSEMKGAAQTRNAPTRRFSFSLYISFPDAIKSVFEEMSRHGNGIQVKNDPDLSVI